MIAQLLLLVACTLIYFEYRVAAIAIAAVVAFLAFPQWYWMFSRGRSIDSDARTPSGRPIHARTYLICGVASVLVVALALIPASFWVAAADYPVVLALGAVLPVLVYLGLRRTVARNNDPVNIGLTGMLTMCASGDKSQEDLVEYIHEVFRIYDITPTRLHVATRLLHATTMIDRMPIDHQTKKKALIIARDTADQF